MIMPSATLACSIHSVEKRRTSVNIAILQKMRPINLNRKMHLLDLDFINILKLFKTGCSFFSRYKDFKKPFLDWINNGCIKVICAIVNTMSFYTVHLYTESSHGTNSLTVPFEQLFYIRKHVSSPRGAGNYGFYWVFLHLESCSSFY